MFHDFYAMLFFIGIRAFKPLFSSNPSTYLRCGGSLALSGGAASHKYQDKPALIAEKSTQKGSKNFTQTGVGAKHETPAYSGFPVIRLILNTAIESES